MNNYDIFLTQAWKKKWRFTTFLRKQHQWCKQFKRWFWVDPPTFHAQTDENERLKPIDFKKQLARWHWHFLEFNFHHISMNFLHVFQIDNTTYKCALSNNLIYIPALPNFLVCVRKSSWDRKQKWSLMPLEVIFQMSLEE